jgi:hypothetical protein
MNKQILLSFFGLLLVLSLSWQSCRKFDFVTEESAGVSVSRDSLLFDTVFTSIGSVTRSFKVYNPHSRFLKLDRIFLQGESVEQFQLNVDGVSGRNFENIEIAPGDSLYVFVRVRIDPNQPLSVSPFVISDAVVIRNGNFEKKVLLQAWGQNANYFPSKENRRNISLLTCNNGVFAFDDPKPYVIYGVLLVDSCTLYIPPGQRVYIYGGIANFQGAFYGDGQLQFLSQGRLIAEGTPEQRIVIEGTRTEPEYREDWGQWERLQFSRLSRNHRLEYTDIREGNIGLFVDSLASVRMEGVRIYNNASHNLLSRHGEIEADNCLFHTSGDVNVQLNFGGKYTFRHCTFVNHRIGRQALQANNFLCTAPFCSSYLELPLQLKLINSIVSGTLPEPFSLLSPISGAAVSYAVDLDHSLVKVKDLNLDSKYASFFDNCNNCLLQQSEDKVFLFPDTLDFRLDTLSVARGKGRFLLDVSKDILGMERKATPDLGCFEFND